MKTRQLQYIHCPFCHSKNNRLTHLSYYGHSQHIRFGLLQCSCDTFPIIEGIVVFRRSQHIIVEEIQKSHSLHQLPRFQLLLGQLSELRLIERRVFVALVWLTHTVRSQLPDWFHQHAQAWWSMGLQLLELTAATPFLRSVFRYYRTRDRRPTYVLINSILPVITQAKTCIEVGFGAGHLVREMAGADPTKTFYCLDKNFWLLYWQACTGLVPPAACLMAVDFEGGLPLETEFADVVLANDTIMYVDHQQRLAQEMQRVMKSDGWCVGMHTHLQHQSNVAQGNGIQPNILLNWLGLGWAVVWSDNVLYEQLWKQQTVPFSTQQKKNWVLNRLATSFSFMATRQKKSAELLLNTKYRRPDFEYFEDQW